MKRKKDSLKKEESRGGGGEEVGGNYGPTDRETHFQSEFYSGRQIDRNAVSQTDRHTDRHPGTYLYTGRKSVSQYVSQTGRPTHQTGDRQTETTCTVSQSVNLSISQ